MMFVNRVRRHLSSGERVLDVGCGNGMITCSMASYVGHITGLDFSQEMIASATEHAEWRDCRNVSWEVGTVGDMVEQGSEFDVVTSFHVLHHIDSPDNWLNDIHRLLADGGRLIIAAACLKDSAILLRWGLKIMGGLGIMPPVQLLDRKGVEEMVVNAGFAIEAGSLNYDAPEIFLVARNVRKNHDIHSN